GVETAHARAHQPEVLGVLERSIRRHGERRGTGDEPPVRQAPAGGGVHDRALLGVALALVHAPRLRSRPKEHLPRGGARLTEQVPGSLDRVAAARSHGPRPARGILRHRADAHRRPVGLELLGENHREARLRALTHLGSVERERDDAVRAGTDPRIGGEGAWAGVPARRGSRSNGESDHETGGCLDKVSATDRGGGAHGTFPYSAWCVVRGCLRREPLLRCAPLVTTHYAPRTSL